MTSTSVHVDVLLARSMLSVIGLGRALVVVKVIFQTNGNIQFRGPATQKIAIIVTIDHVGEGNPHLVTIRLLGDSPHMREI